MVLARESVGDVRALPRPGLYLEDGSRLDDSFMTGNVFSGHLCTGRQGPQHAGRNTGANAMVAPSKATRLVSRRSPCNSAEA